MINSSSGERCLLAALLATRKFCLAIRNIAPLFGRLGGKKLEAEFFATAKLYCPLVFSEN